MPTVFIPSLMRPATGGIECVTVEGNTVREVIAALERKYPDLAGRLVEDSSLKPGLSVTVDGHVAARGLFETVHDDSEIHFLPAIGGG